MASPPIFVSTTARQFGNTDDQFDVLNHIYIFVPNLGIILSVTPFSHGSIKLDNIESRHETSGNVTIGTVGPIIVHLAKSIRFFFVLLHDTCQTVFIGKLT